MDLLSESTLDKVMIIGTLSHLRTGPSTASFIQQAQGESLGLDNSPSRVGQDWWHSK